ncbi:hypothetical protein [Paenibacillus elgii]|uniref:hypothetical protein n=1 Tax=Paenibacillus elgii TaxID=189691 RepID=UPI000248D3B3|nr:hypothetical protein [Paenibacillus elgii]
MSVLEYKDYLELLTDPRPDLSSDSHLWPVLMREVFTLPDRLLADEIGRRLWTIRSIGTVIQRTHNGIFLSPVYESQHESGWPDKDFFEEMKRLYLAKHSQTIMSLLGKLG